MPISISGLGDPIPDVAVLLAESFREDRKQALDASDAAEAARLREAEQRVEEMRREADSIRHEGLIKGATTMLSGAATITGALLSIGESDIVARRTMDTFSAGGRCSEAIGTAFGSSFAADAKEHQGEADLHEARSSAYKVAAEKYRDQADEAKRMTKKVTEFLQQMTSTGDATAGSAAAIRG